MAADGGPSRPSVHRVLAAALEDNELWDRAEQMAGIGVWEWDLSSDELTWSDNLFRLLGFDPGAFHPTTQRVFERMHPADVERVEGLLEAARRGADMYPIEYRMVHSDGSVRHLQSGPVGEEDRRVGARRLVGFVRDVTEQRFAERELALYRGVARALARWSSFAAGAERLLAEIAGALCLPAAALWLPEPGGLLPRVLWCAPAVDRRVFERALVELRTAHGDGLAGEAWAGGRPALAAAGAHDGSLGRDGAALDGLDPVAAIPAGVDGVQAVIVLYAGERLEAGERLARTFEGLGREVGAFLARRPGLMRWPLTTRELEVLGLAAEGLAGPQIATRLQLSVATVKTHLANAYAKIGVSSRVAAVAYALREGLIE